MASEKCWRTASLLHVRMCVSVPAWAWLHGSLGGGVSAPRVVLGACVCTRLSPTYVPPPRGHCWGTVTRERA